MTVSRYPFGELYEPVWEGGDLAAQWERLAALIRELDPRRIGINVSDDWPVADGLSASLRARLGREPVSTKRDGMGIGVLLSRSIVERLGGSLVFDHGGERGTRVRLTLPLSPLRTG